MTIVQHRNSSGDYEFAGYEPVPGYSRVANLKAKPALTTFFLKRAVSTCQWAAANGDNNWIHAEPYHIVREINDADTRKADIGTCVARACELVATEGLAAVDAAKQAVIEQEHQVATWQQWNSLSATERRKQKLRKPYRINFTPEHELVVAYVQGFIDAVTAIGFRIEHAEQTVFTPGMFAGTADIFGRFPGGPLQCWDIKTGSSIHPDMNLQLGAYSNASHWVTGDNINPQIVAAPDDIDLHHGGIFHVTEHGTDVYPMNLDGAWEAFTGLLAVRRHEQICKDTRLEPAPVHLPATTTTTEPVDQRTAWVQSETQRISATGPDAIKALTTAWPAGVDFKPPWTDDQVTELDAVVTRVAHRLGLDSLEHPFGLPDPKLAPTPHTPLAPAEPKPADQLRSKAAEGDAADREAVRALIGRHTELHPDQVAVVQRWLKEASAARRPFGLGNPDEHTPSIRRFECARAAIEAAANLVIFYELNADDHTAGLNPGDTTVGPHNPTSPTLVIHDGFAAEELNVREALHNWLNETAFNTDLAVGALIGTLTAEEAADLAEIAHKFPTTGELEAK